MVFSWKLISLSVAQAASLSQETILQKDFVGSRQDWSMNALAQVNPTQTFTPNNAVKVVPFAYSQ